LTAEKKEKLTGYKHLTKRFTETNQNKKRTCSLFIIETLK
jgi:hypothetical protein